MSHPTKWPTNEGQQNLKGRTLLLQICHFIIIMYLFISLFGFFKHMKGQVIGLHCLCSIFSFNFMYAMFGAYLPFGYSHFWVSILTYSHCYLCPINFTCVSFPDSAFSQFPPPPSNFPSPYSLSQFVFFLFSFLLQILKKFQFLIYIYMHASNFGFFMSYCIDFSS